jgi:hypothetical protein
MLYVEPGLELGMGPEVGRCALNSADPALESDWFSQTLTLEHQSWFQNVRFTFNLRRYASGAVRLWAVILTSGLSLMVWGGMKLVSQLGLFFAAVVGKGL